MYICLDFGFGKKSMEGLISHEVTKLCNYLKKDLNQPTSLGRSTSPPA